MSGSSPSGLLYGSVSAVNGDPDHGRTCRNLQVWHSRIVQSSAVSIASISSVDVLY